MYRKKLIEVALPLEAINVASAREKSIRHGHPSTLHLWWARRPLAAARAVIFTSLVDDPDDPNALPAFVEACKQLPRGKNVDANGDTPRMRLFDFIERLVTWEATTDEAILNTARELIMIATEGNPPPLLDPFAGGGSIPLEAQRLGLEAHASDLNPVAVMINKAQIEIPPRFANMPPVNPRDRERMSNAEGWKGAAGLAADVRYYGEWMREKAWEKIGHLYPTHNGETVIAWLWARTVKSPNPAVNAQVPLVRSFILSKKKGHEYWAKPIIENDHVHFEITKGLPPKGKDGTIQRGNGICIISGEPIPGDYIRNESMEGRMSEMLMAIVTTGANGRNYYSPDTMSVNIAQSAKPNWKPTQEMNRDTSDLVSGRGYGFFQWSDLFTSRQLLALTTYSSLVSEVSKEIFRDALATSLIDDDIPLYIGGYGAKAYAEAVSVYLGFGVSKLTDQQNSFCRWKESKTQVVGLFSRQAIPMMWDYAENNIFNNAAGDYNIALNTIAKALERFTHVASQGVVSQADATLLNTSKTAIFSTDPPYYDNISYADLSDFFYVWMRKILQEIYPDIFGTMLVPKETELIASSYRHGGKEKANQHFEDGMLYQFADVIR